MILIGVHEFGHFSAAKLVGIKVLRFSIGFGRPIIQWKDKKQDTEYSIGWLPLGGYVRLLDSREAQVSPELLNKAFDQKPIWQRMFVICAGPLINLLFALIVFYSAYIVGIEAIKPIVANVLPHSIASEAQLKPKFEIIGLDGRNTRNWKDVSFGLLFRLGDKDQMLLTTKTLSSGLVKTHHLNLNAWNLDPLHPNLLKSLGLVPEQPLQPAVIDKLEKKGPAELAGLRVGDEIISINNEVVKNWPDLVLKIWSKANTIALFKIKRVNQRGETFLDYKVYIKPQFSFKKFKTVGYIGIKPIALKWLNNEKYEIKYTPVQAILPALSETWLFFKLNAIILGKMFIGRVSLKNLGGPITLFQTASLAFKQGLIIFLIFLGEVSVMLSFINLLPIPGLDGGQLLYLSIEKIRGKKLSLRLETLIVQLSMIALVLLIIHVTVNDIMRLLK